MTEGKDRPYIAVIGSQAASARESEAAYQVGAGLADAGAVVICGGLGGVMAAACRGARDHAGTAVGLLPGSDRSEANPYLDIAIATGLGETRNAVVACAADAVIAIGGEFGTLSEIALALKQQTAVVALDSWQLARAGEPSQAIEPVAGATEAVERALALAR